MPCRSTSSIPRLRPDTALVNTCFRGSDRRGAGSGPWIFQLVCKKRLSRRYHHHGKRVRSNGSGFAVAPASRFPLRWDRLQTDRPKCITETTLDIDGRFSAGSSVENRWRRFCLKGDCNDWLSRPDAGFGRRRLSRFLLDFVGRRGRKIATPVQRETQERRGAAHSTPGRSHCCPAIGIERRSKSRDSCARVNRVNAGSIRMESVDLQPN